MSLESSKLKLFDTKSIKTTFQRILKLLRREKKAFLNESWWVKQCVGEEMSKFTGLEQLLKKQYDDELELETIKHKSTFAWVGQDFFTEHLGLDNYTPRSLAGLRQLAKSIDTIGLIEKPALNISPATGELSIIDGRRRAGACILANYSEIPVDVYSVPEEEVANLELSLNALKTRILMEDKLLLAKYFIEDLTLLGEPVSNLNKEIAQRMHCTPTTVAGYRTFLEAHSHIQNYVQEHRNLRLFTQVKQIVKKIPDKNQQLQFFSWYKKNYLETKDKDARGKLNPTVFSAHLKSQAETFAAQRQQRAQAEGLDDGSLPMILKTANKFSYKRLNEIAKTAKKTSNYLNIFTRLLALDTNLQVELKKHAFDNGGLEGFVNEFKTEFKKYLLQAPKRIQTKITNQLEYEIEQTLAQQQLNMVLANQSKARKHRPKVFGEKAEYIRVDKINLDSDNLRRSYDNKRIQQLATDFKKSSQIKAGVLLKIHENDDVRYNIIVGKSRFQGVVMAGIEYYKAYVVDSMEPDMIRMMQAAEDLFEDDKYYSRIQQLFKNYTLRKQIAKEKGMEYTPEEFIEERKHVVPKQTLQDAMYIMSLSEITKYVIKEQFMSVEAGKFMEAQNLDDPQKFSVLINAITNNYNTKKVKDYIQNDLLHPSLFEEDIISYDRIITNFKQQLQSSLQQLQYVCVDKTSGGELLQRSEQIFMRFANVYSELNGLLYGINMLHEDN